MKMKKTLSLVLSLCLALAAVPALAEDFTGTWYILMIGMTVGSVDLNADGTAVMTANAAAEEVKAEGTWSAEDNIITLNISEQPMVLAYDGTGLKLDASALSVMGISADSMGMDASMLDSLLQVSREPGTLTIGEFTAYMNEGTIPEGKTSEEMQAVQTNFMTLMFSLMGSIGSAVSSGVDSPAEEAPELTVLEDNFYVRKSFGDQLEGCYIAKVQNQNDAPLYINDATLILTDAEGNEVGKTEYLGRSGSRYLEPGEISFISVRADVAEGAQPATYEVSIGTSASSYGEDLQLEVAETELRKQESYWTTYYAAATITNNGDAPLSQASAVIAIKDADGKLLDLASVGLYQNELAPGSTITLLDNVDSSTIDYCTENGIELGEVEAFGWVDKN